MVLDRRPSSRLRRLLGHCSSLALQADTTAAIANKGGPLKGVKVLDLCAFINGPGATMQMADNGADVIRIEPPEGEGLRVLDQPTGPDRLGYSMENYNRGKKSIVMDLKHPRSKEVMERLVKWADVVAENFRPYVMESLGLGYEVLKKWNPKIILASNSGFGDRGEWAERACYDGIAQAFTGIPTMQAGGPSHKPQLVEWAFSDEVGSMNFYSAIVNALFARTQNPSGEGQHIKTSQTAASIFFQRASIFATAKTGKQRDDGLPALAVVRHLQMLLQAGDGKYFTVNHSMKAQFVRWCNEVLNRPDLLEDERIKKYPDLRGKDPKTGQDNRDWLVQEVQKIVSTQPRDHWLELGRKASVPVGPVSTYSEVADPNFTVGKHLFANDYLMKIQHRDQGELTVIGQPAQYGGTPNQMDLSKWHSPDLGEHTAETLKEIAGYSDADLADLMKAGGAAPPPPANQQRRQK